jgi:hypothetical protein
MLCKLLTCRFDAVERRRVPYGTVNLCADHAGEVDRWSAGDFVCQGVLTELMFACRYGPADDPPLEVEERGLEYAHRYKSGAE